MINISKIAVIMIAFLAITTTSCKKDNFDEPPFETVDPNLPVTHTIADLKLLFSGTNLKLTDDIIISGIVVANDKSGNIFNQIIIDDGSKDGTSQKIKQMSLNDSNVRYIIFSKNFGKEAALYAGLEKSHGECSGVELP